MSLVAEQITESTPVDAQREPVAEAILRALRDAFETEFALWNGCSGEILHRPDSPIGDELALSALVRICGDKGEPQFLAEVGPICVLALPVAVDEEITWVATAPFATGTLDEHELSELERWFGVCSADIPAWIRSLTDWPPKFLLKLAKAVQEKLQAQERARRLSNEIDLVTENLASTYEEISLLYEVTKNLRISSTDEELGRLAIEWLGECVPAEAFAVVYLPTAGLEHETYKSRTKPLFITSGESPVDENEFLRLIEILNVDVASGPYVANHRVTEAVSWQFPRVRQLIVVPLVEGKNVFGWIAAFNHTDCESFGTVEANLIGSLGTLLGIHCGNRELYRQQSDLLANIVRALVSAIDAKDPYTSGHSDRVARIAVRIGLELHCNPKLLNTIYMAGLLHDVGKIGIDDNVLRKAGHLTDVEFEHIKKHPELGFKILADLKPLAEVLPAVLHHHEQWDGCGYPHGLAGENIPRIARILSVADAYDAMTSDRPYRRGMPEDRVDEIFRTGAGRFWDSEVVEAFLKAKEEICAIARRERTQAVGFEQQFV